MRSILETPRQPQPVGTPVLISQPKRHDHARVVVFGSFMGGYHVLRELLTSPLADRLDVVGVATDDPTQPFTHPNVRLWRHPHTRNDETMVSQFAGAHSLPDFTGRIKTRRFWKIFSEDWRPDLCLMATFGQKIPDNLIHYPSLGFFNFHHSAGFWPSYPGPDPIGDMIRDGRKHLVLTMHQVTRVIDGGEFVARSHPIAIPPGVTAMDMHRITWPQMGPFIRGAVDSILDASPTQGQDDMPMLLQEAPLEYRTQGYWENLERIAA